MKFTSTALAIGAIASSSVLTSAQTVDSPLELISYVSAFLSPGCLTSIESLISGDLGKCVQLPAILPILNNTNTSIVPQLDTYFKTVCAAPACTETVIQNATQTILTGCATELSLFGVSNSTVEIIAGAYDTAREVVCLSTTKAVSNSSTNATSPATIITPINSTLPVDSSLPTNSTSNSTLCPTSLLYELEGYLGAPLTNAYIDTLILGGNSTAYNLVQSLVSNVTVLRKAVCNDCVQGSVDIIFDNYPSLEFYNVTVGNASYSLDGLYEGLCNVTVGANGTIPTSLNQTAYNTTLPTSNVTSPVNITSPLPVSVNSTAARKRFMRWD